MKKLVILFYTSLVTSLLFSLSCFSIHVGVELLAFPTAIIFTIVLSYFVVFVLLKKKDTAKIGIIKKLYEYLPFVMLTSFILRRASGEETSFTYDLICVLLWVVIFISGLFISLILKGKKSPFDIPVEKKSTGIKRVICEILEWIDAFVQAAFMVSLINIFIFQLYEIPSESMVPQFLIGDRVMVFKTAAGPCFPLSEISIPKIKKYKRGDIVVFRNPHYESGKKNEVKSFVNQLVYMLSFTTVNLNVDSSGKMIADPLVKRVTGVPGEQLVMVDGVLYARTEDNPEFKPVEADNVWAVWNLNDLDSVIKKEVDFFPINQKNFETMIKVEKLRQNLSIESAERESISLSNQFETLYKKLSKNQSEKVFVGELFSSSQMNVYNMFSNNIELTRKLLTTADGCDWFKNFMCDWTTHYNEDIALINDDLYEKSMYRLNILTKLAFGRLVIRNLQIIDSEISSSTDEERLRLMEEAQELYLYVVFNDSRNMPVFPADKNGEHQYIPEGNFFMMGDNRFNSLDMRHSYDSSLIPVSMYDDYTMYFESRLAPQYVSEKRILGTTCLRFWPVKRFGTIKNKAKQ